MLAPAPRAWDPLRVPPLRLERIAPAHTEALRDMAREFAEAGDPRLAASLEDPAAFFDAVERFAEGRDLPEDRVQQSEFLVFGGERLLGRVRLRHRLIPPLERDGGNLGYEIRPTERGKGHATDALRLGLDEARRIGLERVLLTAAETNLASRRVIEKHGGEPDGTRVSPNTGERMQRYWIRL